MENSNQENIDIIDVTDIATVPKENELKNQQESRFDIIADFFKRMTIGILRFAFLKLPEFIWKNIKYLLEEFPTLLILLKKIWRMVFWFTTWMMIVFAAWLAFGFRQFVRFWTWVGAGIGNILTAFGNFVVDNAGPIWFIIAICGSIYGLLYRQLKKNAAKKGVPFRGVFAFLRRKKVDAEDIHK